MSFRDDVAIIRQLLAGDPGTVLDWGAAAAALDRIERSRDLNVTVTAPGVLVRDASDYACSRCGEEKSKPCPRVCDYCARAFRPATEPPTKSGQVLIRDALRREYSVSYFSPKSGPGWWWLGRSDGVESLSWAPLPEVKA